MGHTGLPLEKGNLPMNRLDELHQKLTEGQTDEMRRHAIVQIASAAADEIIFAGCNGTPEEIDYLTSAVAQVMNNRVHLANVGKLLRKQLHFER
jgi:restriction endonuclease Mrr